MGRRKHPPLAGEIRRLKKVVKKSAKIDPFLLNDLIERWTTEDGFDKMGLIGDKRRRDGTTFSLKAIESLMANIELWLLCRIAHRWSKTKMTPETAPYELKLKIEVDFGDDTDEHPLEDD